MPRISVLSRRLKLRAEKYHGDTPGLKKLPFGAVAIILALALVNALVWAAVGVVLVGFRIVLYIYFCLRH